MKNLFRAFAIASIISFCFASCKSHEKCPAYGELNKAKENKEVRG